MKKPIIVELVGPAGAGKSTLSKALQQCNPKVRLDDFPDVRAVKNVPFFVWNALLLLPTFLTIYRHKTGGYLTRREMVYMAVLTGWPRVLKRSANGGDVVILDQGPVYMLAELHRFGLENLTGQRVQKWWDTTCNKWSKSLDMVICLDTADSTLVERIRSREKEHCVKENSDQWAREFLAHCRAAQEKVLLDMNSSGQSPTSFRFDTSKMSLDETVDNILALL